MNKDIIEINESNYIEQITDDIPIEYKGLKIYPVRMNNYFKFQTCSSILTINKNKIPDPKVISMSYLDFIFHLITNSDTQELKDVYRYCFVALLSLTMPENEFESLVDKNGKYYLKSNEIIYDKKDFDNIKKIIIMQNMPDYDDTYIDPKVEEVLSEAQNFLNRNKKKMGTLEDQKICVMISTSLKWEDINNLTIRKFIKTLQRVDYKLHYEIYKTASLSGMVEFKKEIDHWMTEIRNEKYADVIVDYGEIQDKLKHVT